MSTVYFTAEGLDKLQAELQELKSKGRAEAAKAIAEARAQGDLSENAEYDAAKEAQGLLEKKIADLENSLANARILDNSKIDISKVTILSKVELKNLKMKKNFTYTLVSDAEANLKESKLSVSSPIGKAILGKKKGDKVEVQAPTGKIEYEIVKISLG
ncbi:MAG: transcription elongation factor GreA [Bacteroidota bacterium]